MTEDKAPYIARVQAKRLARVQAQQCHGVFILDAACDEPAIVRVQVSYSPEHRATALDVPDRYVIGRGALYEAAGFPCAVVATWGAADDWAAYIGGYPAGLTTDQGVQWVAGYGMKLEERVARKWFPGIKREWRE